MLHRLALVAMGSVFAPCFAFAFPMPKAGMRVPKTMSQNYDFEGIVALSNCSGSLIRFEFSKDSDQAVVLTNGHCYEEGMPDPGQVISHQPSSRSFRLYNSAGDSVGRLNATQVMYSTMTRTDITMYKLRQTYADIMSQYHVRPFVLSSKHPEIGTAINVVSGYWESGYSCQIEFFVHELDEAGWKMFDSVRYSRPGCEVIGGTSGSPVIQAGTRNVIAINNTGNEDGERCTLNNPCEIDDKGQVTYHQGYSYGEQTYWIYSCLTDAGDIDLSKTGCLLPQ
jgi:V8-like Glu-specific endopeptidase